MAYLLRASLMFLLFVCARGLPAGELDAFQWKHRIVMVFLESASVEQVVSRFKEMDADVTDRHILWFVIHGEHIETNYSGEFDPAFASRLSDRYASDQGDEIELVLVGKDGGVKYRSNKIEPEIVFGRIDRMPMRQAEMRNSGNP